jgi:hypothetical protein
VESYEGWEGFLYAVFNMNEKIIKAKVACLGRKEYEYKCSVE